MSLSEVDFDKIRVYDNSRNSGFEELCCQLAALEPRCIGDLFIRKGRGGDAGVECYVRKAAGGETGWQSKYVPDWTAASGQLDGSIRTALDKHPALDTYIVCLPFDLADARVENRTSAYDSYAAWRTKWLDTARSEGRPLDIQLWGKSQLAERLARDDAAYAGRLFYWFEQQSFGQDWFEHRLARTKKALGSRYSPETNVELPIRRTFLALARDGGLNEELAGWQGTVHERAHSALRALDKDALDFDAASVSNLRASVAELEAAFPASPVEPTEDYPLSSLLDALAKVRSANSAVMQRLYTSPPAAESKHGVNPLDWAIHEVRRLSDVTSEMQRELASGRWTMANRRSVLLYGPGGIGKSHLLADVTEHQVERGRPALLIMSSTLVDGDPWSQIIRELDLPSTLQTKHLLGALDAAAEAANCRALISIDALNERHGLDLWPERLAAFLDDIGQFPRLAVVLSCRTTYLPHIVPDSLAEDDLPRIEHAGFGGDAGAAASAYLAKRGIVRPGAPSLLPEFNNPLFLKTCCDFLERQGKRELPRGLRGVTQIFDFYTSAIVTALNRTMKLDARHGLITKAIEAMADALADTLQGYLPADQAIAIFEGILASQGKRESSLLHQLESEGLLSVELVSEDQGGHREVVRFTFERLSDHIRAGRLLDQHLDVKQPSVAFAPGQPLHDLVLGERAYQRAGVIEAVAIQLPERADVELPDMIPSEQSWAVDRHFISSLLWRDQRKFSARTLELARQFNDDGDDVELLIGIATEPDNQFNANYLHSWLAPLTMAERDSVWSTAVSSLEFDEGSTLETLISWAFAHGFEVIEADRAELAGTVLTWLLSTSSRIVRDRATKALASLLAPRLALATTLVRRFATVDDLYVRERLLAAAYGAALQGMDQGSLRDLAAAVFETVFAGGRPPAHVLLRDYASGLLAYADRTGNLPDNVDIRATKPPFVSDWPIEYVSDERIASYKEDWGRGAFSDGIVSSTVNDGDFARYRIDGMVAHWSPASIQNKRLPADIELYSSWFMQFSPNASEDQLDAFKEVMDAAEAAAGQGVWEKSPERERLDAAEKSFAELIGPDAWERYRVEARDYLNFAFFAEPPRRPYHAAFNNRWARRWICKRAHDLGWTAARFGKFDRSYGRRAERHEHAYERIGKKYQWLAFHELAARMADNLAFLGGSRFSEDDRVGKFTGAADINVRDIDPSLLVASTNYDGWRQWSKTWWLPAEPRLHPQSPVERLAWLETDDDLVHGEQLIEVVNPKDKRRWLVLHSFGSWRQSGLRDGEKQLERDVWFRLTCLVVEKKNLSKFLKGLSGKDLRSAADSPKVQLSRENFIGEYPWHPSMRSLDAWEGPSQWSNFAVRIKPTATNYLCESGGYDYSISESVNIELPAPWLHRALDLRLASGKKPVYVGANGSVLFFDPSVSEIGPQAALVDREAFLAALDREGLAAVWIIVTEKSVYGGRDAGRGFGGSRLCSLVYSLSEDGFTVSTHTKRETPSRDQLEELVGSDLVAEIWAAMRSRMQSASKRSPPAPKAARRPKAK